jgi:hypothetical protein
MTTSTPFSFSVVPLLVLGLPLASCDDLGLSAEPSAPEFLDTEGSCAAGTMTFTALIRSELAVGNLVLERTDIDHEELDPVFPLVTSETFGGEVTEWTATLDHNCDDSIAVTWTATTLAETVATAETAWPDVSLSEGDVDPPYGSDIGGSSIVIHGTDMHEVDRVWFDGELAEIVANTTDTVTVRTPPHDAGTVDVRYAAGVTELDLPAAFTYWPDHSGQVVGLAHLVTHLYDPTYFTIRSAYIAQEDFTFGSFVQHEVLFHEPIDPSLAFMDNWYAPVGTCEAGTVDWTKTYGGIYLALHEDTLGELPMIPTASDTPTYYFVEEEIDAADWTGITFDLEFPDATDQFPAMLLEDALPIATDPPSRTWDHTTPLGYTSGDDLVLAWSGAPIDKLNVSLYPVYHDWRGIQVLGASTCTWDGSTSSITIPWEEVMGAYSTGGATGFMARIGAMEELETVLAHDNSIFQSTAVTNYWVYYVFL